MKATMDNSTRILKIHLRSYTVNSSKCILTKIVSITKNDQIV